VKKPTKETRRHGEHRGEQGEEIKSDSSAVTKISAALKVTMQLGIKDEGGCFYILGRILKSDAVRRGSAASLRSRFS